MNKHAALYALGTLLLGAVGIWFHEFALQWQAVPAGIPMRTTLAYVSGALLVAGGGAILSGKYERAGALLLACFYGLWVVAFHLPNAFARLQAHRRVECAGGDHLPHHGRSGIAGRRTPGRCAARWRWWRACWPARAPWCSASRISTTSISRPPSSRRGFRRRRCSGRGPRARDTSRPALRWSSASRHGSRSRCTPVMMASFVLFVHLPRVIGSPEKHDEWIMLAVSSALTGSALLIRKYST